MNDASYQCEEFLASWLDERAFEKWSLTNSTVLDGDDANYPHCIKISGVKSTPRSMSNASFSLSNIPVMHELIFNCKLRGSRAGQWLRVNVLAYNSKNHLVLESTQVATLDNHNWNSFKCAFVLPPEAVTMFLFVNNFTAQPAYLTHANLRLGAAQKSIRKYCTDYSAPSSPDVSKAIFASYKACVKSLKDGDIGTLTFPIPGVYKQQIPLTFEVKAKPRTAILDYKIRRREDGINWVAEVRVKPPKKGAIINWESLVLTGGSKENFLKKNRERPSDNSSKWLKSTKCVQSNDPAIKEKAEELANCSSEVKSYVTKVVDFVSKNKGSGKKFDSLDAKTALEAGGSCTSRANLAAALLRAKGIPARTVAHLPTWHRGPLFEHWLVEYWDSDYGWVAAEPTLNRQPNYNALVIIAISSSADEEKSDNSLHLRYIMPGAAYLSGCELSQELVMATFMPNVEGPNIVVEEAEIIGSQSELQSLFDTAHQSFTTRVEANGIIEKRMIDAIRLAARDGRPQQLQKQLLLLNEQRDLSTLSKTKS